MCNMCFQDVFQQFMHMHMLVNISVNTQINTVTLCSGFSSIDLLIMLESKEKRLNQFEEGCLESRAASSSN